MTAFEEYGIIPQLSDAIDSLGWRLPTPVQSEAIPAILGGADVLIAAETGSGKTGAFCLPISQIVYERRRDALNPSKPKKEQVKKFVLNKFDRDARLTTNDDELTCDSRVPKEWNGVRATAGVHGRGKYYYEAVIKRDGLCRVGWATAKAALQIGTNNESYGYGGTGKKSFARNFEDYGKSFTLNDVLGCYLDLDNQELWWSKNGEQFRPGYKIDSKFLNPANCLYPAVVLQNSMLTINFGDTPFAYPPGNGFVGVSKADEKNIQWYSRENAHKSDLNVPLCIVLEPTRELVQQTFNNMNTFAKSLTNPSVRSVSLAAGVDMKSIISQLDSGAEIIIGTPSRVLDLIQTKVPVHGIQFIVIDEVDQFLNDRNGAGRQIESIFKMIPTVSSSGMKRQVIACSATMHNMEVTRFADRHMSFAQWIDLKGVDSVSNDVHHVVCMVDANEDKQWIRVRQESNRLRDDRVHDKDRIMCGTKDPNTISLGTKILKGIYLLKAIESMKMDKAIVFCRTKQQSDDMETFLRQHGYTAACLHGDRSPMEREQSLDGFKNDRVMFLVCTDVAARGLDVSGVPFVINVTLPDDKALYVHRIGRVGRAERMGLSISLVSEHDEKVWFHKCKSRGANCSNTRDVEKGGCTIWYKEKKYLGEIEEHLGCTIAQVDSDFNIPTDEFDGKVVYGERRGNANAVDGHGLSETSSVSQLADLETRMQLEFLKSLSSGRKRMRVQ